MIWKMVRTVVLNNECSPTKFADGNDLTKDGPVTVTFYKAVQHMQRNALGQPLADATYVVNPG